ncbi:MAG: type II toxin-antitoxin system VapC family toxin [Dehalococcoidia bacterium]
MRLLLDTHTLIWAVTEPEKLSERARQLVSDPEHELVVSSVSAVEMSIKASRRKLPRLSMPVLAFMQAAVARLPAVELPLLIAHGAEVELLPDHHRDPFDWMLIAQARVEGLTLVTNDRKIRLYDVETVW